MKMFDTDLVHITPKSFFGTKAQHQNVAITQNGSTTQLLAMAHPQISYLIYYVYHCETCTDLLELDFLKLRSSNQVPNLNFLASFWQKFSFGLTWIVAHSIITIDPAIFAFRQNLPLSSKTTNTATFNVIVNLW